MQLNTCVITMPGGLFHSTPFRIFHIYFGSSFPLHPLFHPLDYPNSMYLATDIARAYRGLSFTYISIPALERGSHLPTISHAVCSDKIDRLYPPSPQKPIAPSYFFAKEKSWTSHENKVKNKSTVKEIRMPKISASKPISSFLISLETSQRNTEPPNRKPWRKKGTQKKQTPNLARKIKGEKGKRYQGGR